MLKVLLVLMALVGLWQGNEHFLAAPTLAKGLPTQLSSAERIFTSRLEVSFPKGTAVDVIRSELAKDGFRLGPYGHPAQPGGVLAYEMMEFETDAFPVHRQWLVGWDHKDGKLVRITAQIRDVNDWF